jgi:hypothetical protein
VPRIPIFKLGSPVELPPPRLSSYVPVLHLDGLHLGIDNVRHDVWLSPAFCEGARNQISALIMKFGGVEGILAADAPSSSSKARTALAKFVPLTARKKPDLKPLLLDLHKSILNQAKARGDLTIDALGRAAILKFLRAELSTQFSSVLDRCRNTLKSYEGLRQQKALEYRERVADFQIAKKHILRQTAQELFRILREIERETLASMRRSLFGDKSASDYAVFLTQLIFQEDARDSYLQAEHYVLVGGFENDPDSIGNIRALVCEFLKSVASQAEEAEAAWFEGWLAAPENANELVATGEPDDRVQKARLEMWISLLERDALLDYAVASYEVLPLIKDFAPLLDPQQLKYALVRKKDRERVEKLAAEYSKLPIDRFTSALNRFSQITGTQRAKVAARYLRDFLLYYRDMRRLEILNAAQEKINLISSEKLSELSKLNGTLYAFFLESEEKSQAEKPLARHVILKADVRDSSRLTKSLLERDMNPASYFSLNFYDPVNKLLPKYGATKVFVEGDAVILAMLEHEGDPALSVARTCVLAREMVEIVGGYNHLLKRAALPALELGIGISYQNSSPMYLLDGEHRIMISDALNESDRLSSCDKRMRKALHGTDVPFNAYEFRNSESTVTEPMRYNVGGIRMSEAAFLRLKEEISLTPVEVNFPQLWGTEENSYYTGLVPVAADVFRRIIIRAARIPMVETGNFNLVQWTESLMYELCTNDAVYKSVEKGSAAGTI